MKTEYLKTFDIFRYKIIEKVAKILKLNNLDELEKIVSKGNENYADYAIFSFHLKKFTNENVEDIIKKILEEFKDSEFKVELVGNYINFNVKKDELIKYTINRILQEKENYGKINIGNQKIVIIEYSSPNIAKPFSIGHLRSTVIGDTLRRIYSNFNYKVVGINYLGDYGTQFGKLIYAYKNLAENNKEERLEKEGIHYLVELYVKYHKIEKEKPEIEEFAKNEFKKLEENDPENLALWKKFTEISLKEFNKIYELLNVKFDSFESESESARKLPIVLEELKKKNLLVESEGALIVDLNKENLGVAVILKNDGTSIYLSRDLSTLYQRYIKYNFDKIIYVVGSEQKLHFKQLFKIAEELEIKGEKVHVDFGLYHLKEGKMSTREGRVVYMEDVIKKVIDSAMKIIEEKKIVNDGKEKVAEKLAIAAIRFNDLSQDRVKDIVFDEEKMLRLDGDTAIYLNYTLVRAKSILEKLNFPKPNLIEKNNFSEIEIKLIKYLYLYPNILLDSLESNKPHILAQYLLKLGKIFNEFYQEVNVLKSENKEEKISLLYSFIYVMENSFNILGLPFVDKM
ncbi:MAG: arginine--tRNA ligase [Candidatus Woesearchaeota archaeon]